MDIKNVLAEAFKLIEDDINKIKSIASSGESLDRNEASKLTDYVRVLLTAGKHQREEAKLNNLENISDAELEELTEQALKNLGVK